MRSVKGSSSVQEEEEFDEDENSAKKETHNNNSHTTKDSKNTDKASVMRSKHSVTEQRRRCKINERFQILRDIIPHSDQKRDTASFLSEVIDYVQHLQERVKTYESSFPELNSEPPTKLMPWRNNHWRVQSFLGPPQAINNCSGPGSAFPGKLDENNMSIAPPILVHAPNSTESETSKVMDRQPELTNKGPLSMPLHANFPHMQSDCMLPHSLQQLVSDVQSTDCPISDTHSQQEDVFIEGGTISISSVYSHGLLSNLTHALQSTGVDLSQANISMQIDLGKRANREIAPGTSILKTHEDPPSNQVTMLPDSVSGEDHVQKRPRT